MKSPLTQEDAESFNALRQTARSTRDIHAWLMARPYLLIGSISLPEDSTVLLDLKIDKDELTGQASDHDVVFVNMEVEVSHCISPPTELLVEFCSGADGRMLQFSDKTYLRLPLGTWPVATALVTARHMTKQLYNVTHGWRGELGERLDVHIAKHFPGMSIEKLVSLHENGLLPLDAQNRPCPDAVMDVLFATRGQGMDVTLPLDM